MKIIHTLLITSLLLSVAACDYSPSLGERTLQNKEIHDYCIVKGGEIEIHEQEDGKLRKTCFINDGVDGIRCDATLFYKRECGHLVGDDEDEHGCKGSAGYSWCENKEKCIRIWEELCDEEAEVTSLSELIIAIKAYNNEKNDITLVGSEAEFTWFAGDDFEELETLNIEGQSLLLEETDFETLSSVIEFFDEYGFELSKYNFADGTVVSAEGYFKDNLICSVVTSYAGYMTNDPDWEPVEDEMNLEIKCGELETTN